MENHFRGFIVEYIEKSKKSEVDELANAVVRNTPLPTDVFFQVTEDALNKMVEPEPELINVIEGEDWSTTIMAYLCHYYGQITPLSMSECSREPRLIR
jgi:hypothetical protein